MTEYNKSNNERDEDKAGSFNMGIDTLMRLGSSLRDIMDLNKMGIKPEVTQVIKINLVKDFFVQASPLLSETIVEKYKKIIFEYKPVKVKVINRITREPQGERVIFDLDLDIKLNQFLIDIQRELQKEGKYLMPSKKDPRFNWSQD